MVTGCAGRGEVVILDLEAPPASAPAVSPSQPVPDVAVFPFEEGKPIRLWSRTHLWGGTTYYAVPGGRPAMTLTRRLVRWLDERGGDVWLVDPRGTATAEGAHITVEGTVKELTAAASSHPGWTNLKGRLTVEIKVTDIRDGRVVKGTWGHKVQRSVFWFDEDDMRQLLEDLLEGTLAEFVSGTTADGLHLRAHDSQVQPQRRGEAGNAPTER